MEGKTRYDGQWLHGKRHGFAAECSSAQRNTTQMKPVMKPVMEQEYR